MSKRKIFGGLTPIRECQAHCHGPFVLGGAESVRAATDAYLEADGTPGAYTFWDYQAGAWQRNNGIRIDHALLSAQAADRLAGVSIHRDVRSWEKPSAHVPLVIELDV